MSATKTAEVELVEKSSGETKTATTKASAFPSCPPNQKSSPKFSVEQDTLTRLIGTRENMDGDRRAYATEIDAMGGVSGLMHKLGTDISGIDASTVAARTDMYGANAIPDRRLKTFCELIFEALQDFTLILLLVSGTTQLLLAYIPATASSCDTYPSSHAWVEPFAIYMAVVVVCLVAAGTDYAKQLQMKEQQAKKNKMSKYSVQRDGKTIECQKTALVVGDIVSMKIGDIVPADAYYIKGKNLALDESALTGEPHLMSKDGTKDPWLLSGTQVKAGKGEVMIVAVGPNSISGEITMKVLGLSEDDLNAEEEFCMDEFLLANCGCFVKPAPVDPRTEEHTSATVTKVKGKGKKASYTVAYSGANAEFLNVDKYTKGVQYDQVQEIMAKEPKTESNTTGVDVNEDDERVQTLTLAVDQVVNVRAFKTVHEVDGEEVSGLEQKLEDMASAITGFGFLLACISMVFASIIWAILKFGLGMTTAIPAGASESGYIVDASFWAKPECSDPSLLACYKYHTTGNASLVGLAIPDHRRMLSANDAKIFNEGDDFCASFYSVNSTGGFVPTEGCQGFGPKFDPQKIVRILVTGITILVVAIPEGLPLAVTLAIAFAQKQLYKLDNFVKTLDSCETMGSATTICSDKTGTLTQNRMTAMNVHLGNKTYRGTIDEHVGIKLKKSTEVDDSVTKLLAHTIAINSSNDSQLVEKSDDIKKKNASLAQEIEDEKKKADPDQTEIKNKQTLLKNNKELLKTYKTVKQNKVQNGNKTECGLLGLVENMGEDYNEIRQLPEYAAEDGLSYGRNAGDGEGQGNPEWQPFSSSRKRMTWVVPHGDNLRCHTKGASEVVLARCVQYLDADGSVKDLTDDVRSQMLQTIITYADEGKRTLALSYRDISKDYDLATLYVDPNAAPVATDATAKKSDDAVVDFAAEHDLILIAIVGIEDPLRVGVKEAIAKCFTAGVDVRMVTGDQINTAIAISTKANILREEHFHHVFDEKDSGFKKYFDLLENDHMAIVDINKVMRRDGKKKDIEAFEQACVRSRGKIVDGKKVTNPVGYVRENFAMTGAEFAARVYYDQTTVQDPANAPEVSYEGTKYEKKVKPGHVNQEELDKIWPKLRVMARCQPQDKLTLVKGLMDSDLWEMKEKVQMLKDQGIAIYPDKQVVAVTGDGTNDAPALKEASVGFAMGIEGTEVAQDAANIILLSDNFADIVVAMKWGRNIYDSIQKFIQFQLTVNIVACVLACIGAVLFQESPLGAVQMLWVNLVMDSLASLALATEPPTEDLLERQPYGVHENIIKRGMWINMIGQAAYQLLVTLIILFKGHILFFDTAENGGQVATAAELSEVQIAIFPDENQLKIGWFAGCDASQHYTLLFHAFVMMTLFNQVAARKLKAEFNLFEGVFNNWIFVFLVFLETLFQVLLVQFVGEVFGCYKGGLTGMQHGYCILFGVIGWIWQLCLNVLARGPLAAPIVVEDDGEEAPAGVEDAKGKLL
jgi:magnesium-transporting ATPase (P-type)